MQQTTLFLWFDKQAREAAALYSSLFSDSSDGSAKGISDKPDGPVDMVEMKLGGLPLTLFNAGPMFQFTPAISLLVDCSSPSEVDALHARLAEGGKTLMPLNNYPFSERYAWIEDRFGLSWQLYCNSARPHRQRITPSLKFSGRVQGKAQQAMDFYTGVFAPAGGSQIDSFITYGKDNPDRENQVVHASFSLAGQQFFAMDSGRDDEDVFNEAISLMVSCDDQEEVDYYWKQLSAVPEAEQCGWLKDRYGLSWQIVPVRMMDMLRQGSGEQIKRVVGAFMQMKKLDLAALEQAYEGDQTEPPEERIS